MIGYVGTTVDSYSGMKVYVGLSPRIFAACYSFLCSILLCLDMDLLIQQY